VFTAEYLDGYEIISRYDTVEETQAALRRLEKHARRKAVCHA
jgi:hypothetical protein